MQPESRQEQYSAPIPSLLALVLCDQIIIEAGTDKKTLVGLFENLSAAREPLAHRVGLFARLTDMDGTYRLKMKVVRISSDGEVQIAEGGWASPVEVPDRLANVDIALNMPPLVFPNFGKYEFQLFANDVYIGRAVLNIIETTS